MLLETSRYGTRSEIRRTPLRSKIRSMSDQSRQVNRVLWGRSSFATSSAVARGLNAPSDSRQTVTVRRISKKRLVGGRYSGPRDYGPEMPQIVGCNCKPRRPKLPCDTLAETCKNRIEFLGCGKPRFDPIASMAIGEQRSRREIAVPELVYQFAA